MGAIKAKCKFPQRCVVLALGRLRGLVAGRRRREGQTSPFNMPGACQAFLGPCTGRKWFVSSTSAHGVGTSATLCPQSTWASGIFSLLCSYRQTAQRNVSLTPKPAILGDLLHHAGGRYHISTTSPSYRSTDVLFPPQLTLMSLPQDSGVMFLYCSS